VTLTEDFFSWIQDQPSIVALVEQRIHPVDLPERSELPALVYNVIDEPRTAYTHDNAGAAQGTTLVKPRIQFDCWAKTPLGAEQLKDALVPVLSGYQGTWGTRPIQSVFVDNVISDKEPDTADYRRIVDAILTFEGV
jgi:hypothetical protein